jgi:hypothetical protein
LKFALHCASLITGYYWQNVLAGGEGRDAAESPTFDARRLAEELT